MIPTSIIYEHENKYVDVYTVRGTHSGILETKNSGTLLILKAKDQWAADRYGHIYVDAFSVVAIREVKPRPEDKDEGEDDCCESDKPKAYFKNRHLEDKRLIGQDTSKDSK